MLLISLLSACGFHLRQSYLIAPELQTLYVSSEDPYGELTRLVKQNLLNNEVTIVKRLDAKTPELRILKDNLDRRTLSVFPNGQVAEYELIYTVRFQLRVPEQEPQEYSFELYRDYQDDPSIALGKSRELDLLLNEMRYDAADRILRDMASVRF